MEKYKILLVEDDEAIGRMLVMNLKIAGYEIVHYSHGTQAFEGMQIIVAENIVKAAMPKSRFSNQFELNLMIYIWRIRRRWERS